ncbi:PREDICTED: BAG family molecular chaperone regulator 1-like [Populus euphratica]|uniref:BAG family molecular chaperone regulator 1-like n=1 Tax=Populus euphratica TaxID=75702 RepID=A0AAJ6V4W0_POPEU|nr:PREDICTED: BAG family molecular chaperone regulator 1-like [Populus euphratica]
MMRMKTAKTTGLSQMNGGSAGGGAGGEWEVRPGGMLVQKRSPDSDRTSIPPPTIRVKVKYGSTHHEINISSQATFGELKKMLSGPTGLHHQDQKLIYKDKERDSKAFLDISGVKDKSKMLLVEDPISQEKRFLEMRKNAKMEKASKSISEISFEVDRLAGQVSALESVITKGGKVAEKTVLNLIELLMNQLLKLDGIIVDGDVKLQRKMQVKRVQRYVETLDMLKIKNSMANENGEQIKNPMPNGNGNHAPMQQQHHKHSNGQKLAPIQERQPRYTNGHSLIPIEEEQPRHSFDNSPIHQQEQPPRHSASGAVVVTTQWETFDSTPALVPVPSTSTSTPATNNPADHQPKFPWDFFN